MRIVPATCVAAALTAATLGCSSSDPPTSNGVVQLVEWDLGTQTVRCAPQIGPPPDHNAAPDTVALTVRFVNTTSGDVTMVSAGTGGTVTQSTASADLNTQVLLLSALPFTPQPTLIRAEDGDVTVRVSLPMRPYCNTKPLNFTGTQDIQLEARMILSSGQYVSLPKSLRVIWGS
jgi:hypothetical protein